jgi:tRNA(Ile)-lysidine synthase TilS/MesJ
MAQEKGCNKLALGHHFDDVIETTMMNMIYAGTFKTMLPKIKSKNFEGLELIRPMYLIKEKEIIKLMESNNIVTMDCGCELQACRVSSKRREMKNLIKSLKKTFSGSDQNIFHAAENVNLDSIARWTKEGKEYSFYDGWDEE